MHDYAPPLYECWSCQSFAGRRLCASHGKCLGRGFIVLAESPSCELFTLLEEHVESPQ